MKSKITDLASAAKLIKSGSSITLGGNILRRQPVAFTRELIRNGTKDLTIVAFTAGLATDMLAGVGAVKRVEAVYSGLFQFGMAYNLRRAVESGEVDFRDFPEIAQIARFRAAATGLTFLPLKDLKGTSMVLYNPEQIKEITCPFTNEKYNAVSAATTDFTVIHGYVGDEYGNVQWPEHRDADDIDLIIAKASNRLIVTVEKIVPHSEIQKYPNRTYIPHHFVEAIVEVPFGAHPAPCDGFYDEDEEHMNYYQQCAKIPGKWKDEYAAEYIYGQKDHWDYLNHAVSAQRLAKLLVR